MCVCVCGAECDKPSKKETPIRDSPLEKKKNEEARKNYCSIKDWRNEATNAEIIKVDMFKPWSRFLWQAVAPESLPERRAAD